jgi:predicted aldo/keto reductase-like oxidoreductase
MVNMELVKLKNLDVKVSPLCLGTIPFGFDYRDLPLEEGADLLLYAYKKGINFWDTAEYYDTYKYIKPALERISSECCDLPRPVISTKSLARNVRSMTDAVHASMTDMGIDHIDIFLMHEIYSLEDWHERKGAWDALVSFKKQGLISAIGVSTHHIEVAELMAVTDECDILFALINHQGLGVRSYDGPGNKEDMEQAIKKNSDSGKDVYTMKAFGGGNLIKDYVKCLDYNSSLPGTFSCAVGMGTREEIDKAVDYFNGRLDNEYEPDISGKHMIVDQGDCIGCGSCIERCKSKAISRNKNGLAEIDKTVCVQCKYCAPVCPVRAIVFR